MKAGEKGGDAADTTDASTVGFATRTSTSYAITFASWKETEKWDGRSMGKKAFKEKFERAIRREPEMMAMWTGGFTEYTAANFVNVQHEFAKERAALVAIPEWKKESPAALPLPPSRTPHTSAVQGGLPHPANRGTPDSLAPLQASLHCLRRLSR